MAQDHAAAAQIAVTRRRRRGGTLICILGIDGAGKSTQAALLVESLRVQDVNAVHAWARWKPILLLPIRMLGRLLAGRKGSQEQNYRGFTDSKKRILRNPLRASLWKYLVLLEHAVQVFFKVRVRLWVGKTVVADRYVYDTLIDLSVNLGCSPEELLAEPILRLYPGPNLAILLDVSARMGAERKADGTTEEYLAERKILYQRLADVLGMEQVDAEESPSEVQSEIRKRVWKRLGL